MMVRFCGLLFVSLLCATWGCSEGKVGACTSHSDCGPDQLCVAGQCRAGSDSGGDVDFVPTDRDNDGVADGLDNCIDVANPDQEDLDNDGLGNVCDRDVDGDGVDDESDNCARTANAAQEDMDDDGYGDVCDEDSDGDGIANTDDNCPDELNRSQADLDEDGIGDLCDSDRDGDGVADDDDNCRNVPNAGQEDSDGDGLGDACALVQDADQDGVEDADDNCPTIANPEQDDSDIDGAGDACDPPTVRRTGIAWDSDCQFTPPVSEFAPSEQWRWPRIDDFFSFPTKTQVMSTPMVANLTDDNGDGLIDADDIPEVVFVSFDTSVAGGGDPADPSDHNPNAGVLRVVDGATGMTQWTGGGDGLYLAAASSVAIGDLNADGSPEIVALKNHGEGLVAFEADGSLFWDCATLGNCFATGSWFNWGGPSIADLDQDGTPEVLYGNSIFRSDGTSWPIRNADGSLRVELTDGTGDNFVSTAPSLHIGALSVALDLDNDGSELEIFAGRTVYRYDLVLGAYVIDSLRSSNIARAIELSVYEYPLLQDGFPAAANFDADAALELVLVADAALLLMDDDGSLLDSIAIPSAYGADVFGGGPPTIADFDGDGNPEIGVAGETRYGVIDWVDSSLQVLWEAPIQETSSSRTGSSVFDFDADGKAEVVYNDEDTLHIYTFHGGNPPAGHSNCDAELCTWERANTSYTAYEYPVIVDADNDGNAEIVVAANDFGRSGINASHGVIVFEDSEDNWVPTRSIWNQHAYHITNVDDDGAIPAVQAPSSTHNSFRKNLQGTVEQPDLRAPDATGFDFETLFDCPASVRIGVWVENRGALRLPSGVNVTVYEGDPSLNQSIGAGQTAAPLAPGEAELVVIELDPLPSAEVWAVIDSEAARINNNECDESNNRLLIGTLACD